MLNSSLDYVNLAQSGFQKLCFFFFAHAHKHHSETFDSDRLDTLHSISARRLHYELLQLLEEQKGRAEELQVCQPHLCAQDESGANTAGTHFLAPEGHEGD